jgi:transcriptional regulator with XRE-family HTH domain
VRVLLDRISADSAPWRNAFLDTKRDTSMAPSPHSQRRQHRHSHQPEEPLSFGGWLRQRRRGLDLTQEALAEQVGCARITIRRIEADELKPSRQLAELLASQLGVPTAQRDGWLSLERGLALMPQSSSINLTATTPATQKGPPTNLPAPLTTFLGRSQEIMDGCRLVTTNRLLTLTGVGGAGKTRLALEIARSILNFRFRILDAGITDNPNSKIQNFPMASGGWSWRR